MGLLRKVKKEKKERKKKNNNEKNSKILISVMLVYYFHEFTIKKPWRIRYPILWKGTGSRSRSTLQLRNLSLFYEKGVEVSRLCNKTNSVTNWNELKNELQLTDLVTKDKGASRTWGCIFPQNAQNWFLVFPPHKNVWSHISIMNSPLSYVH